MKLILTGATGFTGSQVLKQALADSGIDEIIVLTRRALDVQHSKLKSVVVNDFTDYSKIAGELKADACVWALGVSQTEVNEAEYIKITHDYALAAFRAMLAQNPQMRFCFLSGRSAKQDEKSAVLYGRIKGRTERELGNLSPNVFNFRPAMIKPTAGHPSSRLSVKIALPIIRVFDLFTESLSIDVEALSSILLRVAKEGSAQHIFTNEDMRAQSSN